MTSLDHDKPATANRQDFFTRVFDENLWQSQESKSGFGSELSAVTHLIEALPELFKKYGIQQIVDVPCGDFNWMKHVVAGSDVKYLGFDIVPDIINRNQVLHKTETVDFAFFDVADDRIPATDLVFVRDLLIHLSLDLCLKVIDNIAGCDTSYVMFTHHAAPDYYPLKYNLEITSDGHGGAAAHGITYLHRPVCMTLPPFGLSDPIAIVQEDPRMWNGDKTMALWNIEQLRSAGFGQGRFAQ